MHVEKIPVRSWYPGVHLSELLLARIYDGTRMDTIWALRQACASRHQLLLSFLICSSLDMIMLELSRTSKMRIAPKRSRVTGLDWVSSPKSSNGRLWSMFYVARSKYRITVMRLSTLTAWSGYVALSNPTKYN